MRADQFPPLAADVVEAWTAAFARRDRPYFPDVVGLQLEELRTDYCRMRLPYRPELDQPAGVVHGGALATLIDTVVVPAVGSGYPPGWVYLTLNLDVQFLGAVRHEDAIAEGWVAQRGRSIVFCRAEVTSASGQAVAAGTLTYKVNPPPGHRPRRAEPHPGDETSAAGRPAGSAPTLRGVAREGT